jgi:hypothetical protein
MALKEATSSSEHLQEKSLTASLCTVLQHGLGVLRDHPPTTERAATMFDGLFNKINIPLVNQVKFLLMTHHAIVVQGFEVCVCKNL